MILFKNQQNVFLFGFFYIFVYMKEKEKKTSTTLADKGLAAFPVYLPIEKMNALNALAKAKRTPKTRLVEMEIDKLLKREGV